MSSSISGLQSDISGNLGRDCGVTRPVYRLSNPGNGVNARIWNGGDGDNATHGDVGTIWTGPADPEHLFPSHVNAPTAQAIEPDWIIATNNIGGVTYGNDGEDQFEAWGWIDTSALGDVLLRDINGNTGERGEVWIGICGSNPTRQPGFQEGSDTGDPSLMDPVQVPPGLHFIYTRVSDNGAYAGIGIQYTTNLGGGSGWTNFPAADSYVAKPFVECQAISVCDDIPDGWSDCPPELCDSQGTPIFESESVVVPQPATTTPVADNETDTAIRTGQVGTSTQYARADHNHPIRRQANPGDPTITISGSQSPAITQTTITDRWSTEESYSWAYRVRMTQEQGVGWAYLNIPAITGFQQPIIDIVGTYRSSTSSIQEDDGVGASNDGAGPRGPYMGQEVHHWSSTRRIYQGYYRRDNPVDMYIEFILTYIRS